MKTKLLIFIFTLFIFSFKIASSANAQYMCTTDCSCLGDGTATSCSSYNSNWPCDAYYGDCGASCSPDSSCGTTIPTDTPFPTSAPLTCPGQCFLNTDYSGNCSHYSSTYTVFKSYNSPDCSPGGTYSWICCLPGSGPTATPTPPSGGNTCSTAYPGSSCEGGHSLLSDPCNSGGTKHAASQPYCPNYDGSSFYFCCGAQPTPTPTPGTTCAGTCSGLGYGRAFCAGTGWSAPIANAECNGGACNYSFHATNLILDCGSGSNCWCDQTINAPFCNVGKTCTGSGYTAPTCGNTSGEYCTSGYGCIGGYAPTSHTCAGSSEMCCGPVATPTPTSGSAACSYSSDFHTCLGTNGPISDRCSATTSYQYAYCNTTTGCYYGNSNDCSAGQTCSVINGQPTCNTASQICVPGSIQYVCSGTKCP